MQRRRRNPRLGYSMLEVITAFAILALSLSALIPGLANLTGQAGGARLTWAATEFARSMIEPIGISIPLRPGVREGRVADRWNWRIEIKPYRAPDVPIGAELYRIAIEVTGRDSNERIAWLRTIRQAGARR